MNFVFAADDICNAICPIQGFSYDLCLEKCLECLAWCPQEKGEPDAACVGPCVVSKLYETLEHPRIYLNQSEVNFIKTKLNQEPWQSAYNALISEANSLLSQGPWSVTFGGSSSHNYQDEPNREDYIAAINVGKAVRSLGLAYSFSGNPVYAERAIYLIDVWALDPATYMNPHYTTWQGIIELSITMPGMFYGADMIYNYPGWNENDREDFLQWVNDLGVKFTTLSSVPDNNFDNWRCVLVGSAGVLTHDAGLMNFAFNRYKYNVPRHIDDYGHMIKEWGRGSGLGYSTYSMNALIQVAEIANNQGINLYAYDSSRLKLAYDFHAPILASTDPTAAWIAATGKSQVPDYNGDNVASYELAYNYWRDVDYEAVINRWGRPMYDGRTMGGTTLTHGVGF